MIHICSVNWNARKFWQQCKNIIVLDLEGFRLKLLGFFIKELNLCSVTTIKYFSKPHLNSLIYPHTINKLSFGWPTTYRVLIGTKVIHFTVIWKQSVWILVSGSPGKICSSKALKNMSSSVGFHKKLFRIWRV